MKRFLAALTAVLTALSFTACGAKPANAGLDKPDVPAAPAGALRKITNATEQGVYLIDGAGSQRLFCYIDYATQTEVPLCSVPNCAHNSPECTAWLDSTLLASQPVAVNNGTLLFERSQPRVSEEYDDVRMEIWTMGQDGSEPKLFLNAEQAQETGLPQYTDGENFYVVRSVSDLDKNGFPTGVNQTADLVKINISNWQDQQVIASFGAGHQAWILGTYGENGLVVEDLDSGRLNELQTELHKKLTEGQPSPEEIEKYNQELEQAIQELPPQSQSILIVDVKTGEKKEIFRREMTENEGWILNHACGRTNWWKEPGKELSWVKDSGEQGSTVIQWPEALPEDCRVYEGLELAGKLRVTVEQYVPESGSRMSAYLVDMDTGEAQKMALTMNVGGLEQPMDVIAETPKGILTIFELWPDARPGEVDQRIGFISAEDLIAGNRNFAEIDRTALR